MKYRFLFLLLVLNLVINKGFIMKNMCLFILICFTLSACVSLTESAGKVLDGSSFKEKRISQYKTSDIELP